MACMRAPGSLLLSIRLGATRQTPVVSRRSLCTRQRIAGRISAVSGTSIPLTWRAGPQAAIVASRSYWWPSSSKTPESAGLTNSPSPLSNTPYSPTTPSEPIQPTLVQSSPADSSAPPEVITAATPPDAVAATTPLPASDLLVDPAPLDGGLVDTVTSTIPFSTLQDLGFVSLLSPAGLMTRLFYTLNYYVGLPWFWTFVVGVLLTRFLVLPLFILSLRSTARLAPYQPQMAELQKQMGEARTSGDQAKLQTLVMKQRAILTKSGAKLSHTFLALPAQLGVTLGSFIAAKRLSVLPELSTSGFALLPDLGAPSSWYLPMVSIALVAYSMRVSRQDVAAAAERNAHIVNIFVVVSVPLTLVFTSWFPTGLWIPIITGSLFQIFQTVLLQKTNVRKSLGILPRVAPKTPPPTVVDTWKWVQQAWNDRMDTTRKINARQGKPKW